MLLPSSREGYGLIVVEAAARGTPSVVIRGQDNAATELVQDGVNGVVVDRAEPDAIAQAIARIHEGGGKLRRETARWFQRNAEDLSIDASLRRVLDSYSGGR
jgi:glycosyltransferase involved in cell wall biosynthesis